MKNMFPAYLIDKQVMHFLKPGPTEGPIKWRASACLSVHLSFFQLNIFLRNGSLVSSDFFYNSS